MLLFTEENKKARSVDVASRIDIPTKVFRQRNVGYIAVLQSGIYLGVISVIIESRK